MPAGESLERSRARPYGPGPTLSDDPDVTTRKHRSRAPRERWIRITLALLAALVTLFQALDSSGESEPLPQPAAAADAVPAQQMSEAPTVMPLDHSEHR